MPDLRIFFTKCISLIMELVKNMQKLSGSKRGILR